MTDKENVKFHVESGDYFSTLATIVDLVRQGAMKQGLSKDYEEILLTTKDNLLFLQDTYKIVQR
jgi:hypothetical protein